ncbi:hypothetical protein JCM8208_007597 [Rhodotorula glutinis]
MPPPEQASAHPPAPPHAPPTSAPSAAPSTFRPLARTLSAASAWSNADVPAASAHDLPEATRLTVLERALGYAGGAGLRRGHTRRGPVVVGAQGRIDEDGEAHVVEEEVAVGEDGETVEETEARAQAMYARFSPAKKRRIVAIVAYAALLAPFSSSSFLPSIPQISADLGTSAAVINITVAVFILCIGLFPLAFAPYSGLYGRRPIYLISLPVFALGCLGTALSRSLGALIATRILQAFGSSPVLSIGAGTIGDLYQKDERGAAMGLFYLGILVGPATAPAIAGILTEYVRPEGTGWRAMQWLLMSLGFSAFALVFFFLPETAHVKGVDVVRQERLQHRADEAGIDVEVLELEEEERRAEMGWARRRWDEVVWVWINPLGPVKLLAHPTILAISLNSSFTLMSTYTILVPLTSTLAPRYNITNSALLGCFYLAQGVGNAAASRFTGMYADWTLRRWLRLRGGHYYPEDRLRATLIGGGIILPLSVIALGWVLERGAGKVGLAFAVLLLFVDGIGLMCVLTPANTYITDVLGPRSAEGIAVNNACRYILSAAASAFVLPLIDAIGVGWTNTFSAFVVWLGCALVLVTIRWGDRMRALGSRWEGTVLAGGAKDRAQEGGDVEKAEGHGEGQSSLDEEEKEASVALAGESGGAGAAAVEPGGRDGKPG